MAVCLGLLYAFFKTYNFCRPEVVINVIMFFCRIFEAYLKLEFKFDIGLLNRNKILYSGGQLPCVEKMLV